MHDALMRILAAIVGGLLGLVFFGGLWWTVRRGVASERPALWFFGSLLARTGIVLIGFYLIGNHRADRLLLGLAGFAVASVVVTRATATREVRRAS